MEKTQSKPIKLLSVILGLLIGGFMWRCRGESGFGSSWGLYSVGLVLILLVYRFYGKRSGMKYELIPLGAFLTGLGVTGYATVIEQMSGILNSDLPYGGETSVDFPINPYSGMVIILIMGFTLVPFFSLFIGTLFSKKEYKIYHYAIAVAIFFAVSYIVKATIAHPILKAINPEQVKYALMGLQDVGEDYPSAMSGYMHHFGNRRWTQEIPFFENYYMSIEHIGDASGIIAMLLYVLIGLKDKFTAIVSFIIDIVTSIGTTAFTLILILPMRSGLTANITPPRFLDGDTWGVWEFLTGATVGFITLLVVALLPKKYTAQTEWDNTPLFTDKRISFVYNLLTTIFIFSVTPMRVIGIRACKLLKNIGLIEDGGTPGDITTVVLSVILGVFLLLILKKNILDKAEPGTPLGIPTGNFVKLTLAYYLSMCVVVYFCLNHGVIFFLPYKEMTSISAAVYTLMSPGIFVTTLMLITAVIMTAVYVPVSLHLDRKK